MRIALSTLALLGLAQANSLTAQAETMTDAGYGCPETIFPPGTTSPPEDENIIVQAKAAYECQQADKARRLVNAIALGWGQPSP